MSRFAIPQRQHVRQHKAHLAARLQRALPGPLAKDQITDLGLAHFANLESIAQGKATEEILYQWIGGALTFSRIAELMAKDHPAALAEAVAAMGKLLTISEAVTERYKKTGRVLFTGPELQFAREAVQWMDSLAESCDKRTAIRAADWSEAKLNQMIRSVVGGVAP
ncbi:MAG: hypothetical protein HEQ39_09525 [Rhizobacter sp.]